MKQVFYVSLGSGNVSLNGVNVSFYGRTSENLADARASPREVREGGISQPSGPLFKKDFAD